MTNRFKGYYRKDGTYVSPDGYGRKKSRKNNKNDGFSGIILLVIFFVLIITINKCSD